MAKPNHRAFVNAARAKGGVKYFDLGGPVTVGGLTGLLTPQSEYQAGPAVTTNQDFSGVIAPASSNALAGYGQVNENIANETALEKQLLDAATGVGPSPAQTALNTATGATVANANSIAAGVRGASTNSGLVARQAAQTGVAAQQAAAGQEATLKAQEQIAAREGALQTQQQIGQQVATEQGVNANLYGTAVGGQNQQNATEVSNVLGAQGINAATAAANAGANQKTAGGLLGGIASGIGALFAEGGAVPPLKMGDGGVTPVVNGPQSFAGKFLNSLTDPKADPMAVGFQSLGQAIGTKLKSGFKYNPLGAQAEGSDSTGGDSMFAEAGDDTATPNILGGGAEAAAPPMLMEAQGGKVPAMVSPDEIYLSPKQAKQVAAGTKPPSVGEKIKGKAKVAGDSLKNDTVPKMLAPGGVVVKRSMAQDPQKAIAFVRAVLAKQKVRR